MESRRGWLKQSFGKRLNKLHTWNAWIVLILAVTGIILSIGAIRGDLGKFRVMLKQVHIWIGLVSIVLIALYGPMVRKHWKQLRGRINQKGNLLLVIALLVGLSISGLVLWQFKNLPTHWNNAALLVHDLLTWVGIPYVIYHSISRSRLLKRQQQQERAAAAAAAKASAHAASAGSAASAASAGSVANAANAAPAAITASAPASAAATASQPEPEPAAAQRTKAQAVIAVLKNSPITRASFLRLAAGLLLLIGVGPAFYRWLKGAFDTGGSGIAQLSETDGNRMLPPPEPLPDSAAVVGGGAQGNFRVYTVTSIPTFSSDNWQFALSGLVANPRAFSWEEFLELERTVQVSDFHCVTGWSVYSVTWEGIPLKKLLDMANVNKEAKFVKFYSGDNVYTDALSLEQADMEDVMVAVMMDGKPIPQKLGGPVRLIVPKMYAYKSVKWLQGIELIEKEHTGYWELRGYDNDAWV
ncbi:molybdopterin-dependent oxidoreductase [Paenibacillus eucommiae]|uniref:Drug/metabolite transporter (DMT)-like permease n=1 Tax=Paenibacillus eucommiae TaxID=1355755 RepID=A0ABS4IZC9_9BACL|nr:molybdopterin-dependent oxidoreductase [Paenibacillus eucommiae]MBP1992948.1 drug/metabolite transporter (DMT)-like permease [Paenibacillus eucommiae]